MCDWERLFLFVCTSNPRVVWLLQHSTNTMVLGRCWCLVCQFCWRVWRLEFVSVGKGKISRYFPSQELDVARNSIAPAGLMMFQTHPFQTTESLVNCTTLLHLSFYLYFFKHGYFRSNAAKVTPFGSLDQITNCTRDVPFWKGRGRGGEEWGGTVSYLESGGGCLGVESLSVSLKKFCHEHMEKFFLEMSTTASFHSIRLLLFGVELLYLVTVLPLQNGISWPVFVNSA